MIIPKNCQHCFYYYKEEHVCLKHKLPVSNVNSCKNWSAMIVHLKLYEMPEFVDYNQYFLDDSRLEDMTIIFKDIKRGYKI